MFLHLLVKYMLHTSSIWEQFRCWQTENKKSYSLCSLANATKSSRNRNWTVDCVAGQNHKASPNIPQTTDMSKKPIFLNKPKPIFRGLYGPMAILWHWVKSCHVQIAAGDRWRPPWHQRSPLRWAKLHPLFRSESLQGSPGALGGERHSTLW